MAIHKKRTAAVCIVGACVIGTAAILTSAALPKGEKTAYRETQVAYGPLTVGTTETGSTQVGTATQTLEVDISAYSPQDTASVWQMGMPGGMSMQTGQNGADTDAAQERTLLVETLYVSAGQQVSKGDRLFGLTQESVDQIRGELSDDVTDAELALKQLTTEQKSTLLSAQHTYETDMTYGEAAQLEYDETMQAAEEQYQAAQESLEDARGQLVKLQDTQASLSVKAAEDAHLYEEAAYLASYIEREEDPYGYVKALALRESAQATADASADEMETLQDAIAEQEKSISDLTLKLAEAEQNQKLAEVEAQAAYDIRILQYDNASERYSVTTSLAKEQRQAAQEAYETACQKQEQFDASIQDDAVISEYDGIVTQVNVAQGDSLSKGMQLMELNCYEDVTAVVTVDDDTAGQIAVGDKVNIYLPAFPEASYTGVVEEMSDAQVGSSDITYEVSVQIQGDVSGILAGMSSEVTFITKETKPVLFVSNRAVRRDNAASSVLVRDENGAVVSQEIQTGFSDGVYVEVLEGLKEGDTVLMESKVDGT